MFTASRVGPLESQQEVSDLLVNVIDAIASKPENLSKFGEALSIVQTGIGHDSFKGDYADSNQYLMYLPRKRAEGNHNVHVYGRTSIRWRRFNASTISALQVYEEEVNRSYNIWLETNPLWVSAELTQPMIDIRREVALEQIRSQNRGDPNRRDQVISQCGIIIQMLKARINESYWEYLMSTSWRFNFGVSNKDILSVIEGIRNSVANPNAEVNEDAASVNRDRAENDLKDLKIPILVQCKHYEMKRLLESFIENIRRTSSVWTDIQIIKLILTKLEQENIFKDIERLWNTDQRFNACDNFDLFWKILEAEFNLFSVSSHGKEWLKNWQGPMAEINHSYDFKSPSSSVSTSANSKSTSVFGGSMSAFGGGGSMSSRANSVSAGSYPKKKDPILDKFENIQSCHDHLRYRFNESSTPCARGDKCRYVHWEDARKSSADIQGDRAKAAFIKSKDLFEKRKRDDGDRTQAKQLFKQFKAGENRNNQSPQVFAAIDEEEFEAFFMELQKEEEEE